MPFYFDDLSKETVLQITGESFDRAHALAVEHFVGDVKDVQHTFFSFDNSLLEQLKPALISAKFEVLGDWVSETTDAIGVVSETHWMACSERLRVTFDDTTASVLRIAKLIEDTGVYYQGWSLGYMVRGGVDRGPVYTIDGPDDYFTRSSGGLFGIAADTLLGKYSD
ncbi:MAG: hypothetical protein ACRCWJ_13605 [Casimicrobium sp.]